MKNFSRAPGDQSHISCTALVRAPPRAAAGRASWPPRGQRHGIRRGPTRYRLREGHRRALRLHRALKQDKKRRCEKIWLYRDRDTGLPKGDATVSYMDPHAAEAAVNWFNSTQFMGRTLSVSLAERKGAGRASTSRRVTSRIPSGATPTPTTPPTTPRTRTRPPLRTTTTTPTPGEIPPAPPALPRRGATGTGRVPIPRAATSTLPFAAGATDAVNPGRAGAQLAAAAQLATFPPGGSHRRRSRCATGTGRARTRRAVTSTSPTGASATVGAARPAGAGGGRRKNDKPNGIFGPDD